MSAIVNPSLQDFADAAEALGLPSPDLVEKDYWVVRVLSAIHALSTEQRTFVFGGGTSICRAYCLIERMSEDIDLRVIGPAPFTEGARRKIREEVEAALAGLGLTGDGYQRLAFDGNRKLEFHLPYTRHTPVTAALRPEIKLELAFYPLQMDAQIKSVTSFLHQAAKQNAELNNLPCVALEETAAEKFLALLRRVGAWQQNPQAEAFDHTLIRHIHDLGRIEGHIDHEKVLAHIRQLIPVESARYGRNHTAFATNPRAEMARVLNSLTQPEFEQYFNQFQIDMVYGNQQDYNHCIYLVTALHNQL